MAAVHPSGPGRYQPILCGGPTAERSRWCLPGVVVENRVLMLEGLLLPRAVDRQRSGAASHSSEQATAQLQHQNSWREEYIMEGVCAPHFVAITCGHEICFFFSTVSTALSFRADLLARLRPPGCKLEGHDGVSWRFGRSTESTGRALLRWGVSWSPTASVLRPRPREPRRFPRQLRVGRGGFG